jgi:hypothetical protein
MAAKILNDKFVIYYDATTYQEVKAFENPVQEDDYLIPANAVEDRPPIFDYNTHTCEWDWNLSEWVVEEIPAQAIPEAISNPEPVIGQLRYYRNQRLKSTEVDGHGMADRPFTEAELTYRAALRNFPANYTAETNEQNFINLDVIPWPTRPSSLPVHIPEND